LVERSRPVNHGAWEEQEATFKPRLKHHAKEETPMRNSLAIAAVLAFAATGALAQSQTPPAKDGPQNSAINSSDSSNRQVSAPVAGRNSFTEGEAKSRMEKMGFADVTNLQKDDNGVWRGRATKDGKAIDVSLDYQGNVIESAGQGSTAPSNAARGGSGR
jgi:hypothetical protein